MGARSSSTDLTAGSGTVTPSGARIRTRPRAESSTTNFVVERAIVVMSKKLTFQVGLVEDSGSGYLGGETPVIIEIHGTTPFLGLTIWHEQWRSQYSEPFIMVSRTAMRDSELIQCIEREHYHLYTAYGSDPVLTAGRALRHHLENLLLGEVTRKLGEQDPTRATFLANYTEEVIDPISTAVLGICRDTRFLDAFNDDDELWAVGVWRFGKDRGKQKLASLLERGTQVQDILILADDDRGNLEIVRRALR